MSKTFHWGKIIDSETPITGVLSHRSIAWEWADVDICLTCQAIEQSIRDEYPNDEDAHQELYDQIYCDGSHTRLWGDWLRIGSQWEPDKSKDFAAIIRESTVQVVWSKTITRAGLCSPCYPGQADLDSDGNFLAFTLPHGLLAST